MQTQIVNLTIWSDTKDKAYHLAEKITRGKKNSEEDTFESIIEYTDPEKAKDYLLHLKAYTWWPNCYSKSIPEPITDILIINISSRNSNNFEDALKYLNERKGFPSKYLVSNYDLKSLSSELGCEFLTEREILIEKTLQKFLKNAFTLEFSLRRVFEKFDLNKNGFLEKFELYEISKHFAFKFTNEEIYDILLNISKDGKISFDQFKKWWIIGRGDFQSFRRIVDIELGLNNFRSETSNYFQNLRKEVELISTINLMHEGKIVITTEDENIQNNFNHSASITNSNFTILNLKIIHGIEVDSMLESFPNFLMSNPFSFGLEFTLLDAQTGTEVIEVFQNFYKKMMIIPFLRELVNNYVTVNFRHVDIYIIIDISLKYDLYTNIDYVKKLIDINLNLDEMVKNYVGTSNFYLRIPTKFSELLEIELEQFLEKISIFTINCHGEFSHIKHLTKIMWSIIESFVDMKKNSQWYNVHNILNLISNVTKIHLNLKYNHKDLLESLKEIIGMNFVRKYKLNEQVSNKSDKYLQILGISKAKEEFDELRKYFVKFLDKFFNANYKGFIKSNLTQLKQINFDKIQVYLLWPKIKLYMKCGMITDGITKYVNNKYL